jgi:hypothetical protein
MGTASSQANPNADRRHDQSDTSQKDATASKSADDLREILEDFEPEKTFLDDDDIALLRKEIEKVRAANGLDPAATKAPKLRAVQSDHSDGGTSSAKSESTSEKDETEPLPHIRVRESMLRDALLRRMKGDSLVDIAQYYNRSTRQIRRWLTEAKRRQLIRIDKLKPGQELAKTLLMLETHRARLMRLRDQFLENDQLDSGLKVIDMLVKLEDRINRIEHRVGLFELYMWGDPCDAVPGSPGRKKVDDGEFLEVDDYDPGKSGQKRTNRASQEENIYSITI